MTDKRSIARAFVAVGQQLAEREKLVERLPLPSAERARARRMAMTAREDVANAMTSVGKYLGHTDALRGRS